MTKQDKDTEQKIKEAARKVFRREGFSGARMQAIADESGMNKMMLHYYFRSKQHLFDVIFEEDYMNLAAPLATILRNPDLHVEEQIVTFIRRYHDTMIKNPRFPLFLMQELSKNPGRLLQMAQKAIPVSKPEEPEHQGLSATTFMDQVDEGIRQGKYNEINSRHLAVSLLGICIYPFVSGIMVQSAYQMSDEEFRNFLEERKEEVIDHIFRILMKPEYYMKWKEQKEVPVKFEPEEQL